MGAVEVEQIVVAFTDATNRRDVDQMLALVSDEVGVRGHDPAGRCAERGRQTIATGSVGRNLSRLASCSSRD